MKLTAEVVREVAALARLALAPDEVERARAELAAILEYVAALQEVDTTGVEPTAHAVAIPCPQRDDQVAASLPPEDAVANAPERSGTAIAVPRILE